MVRAFVGEARGWREYATLEHDDMLEDACLCVDGL